MLTFLLNSIKMNSYLFALPLTIVFLFNNLRSFPVTHLFYLTYDSHSIDRGLELTPPSRPYATRTPQFPSFDTTSDVSHQTIPSTSNVFVISHNIINPPPNLDPHPPPSSNNPITTQPSSHPPHQYNTPIHSPTPNTPQ